MRSRNRVVPPVSEVDPVKERTSPVIEEHTGDVFPYRGTETHGVDPVVPSAAVPGHDGSVAVPTKPAPPEHEPVPVRIVQNDTDEIRDWAPRSIPILPGQKIRLVGRNKRRSKITIYNFSEWHNDFFDPGNYILWVGRDANVSQFAGVPLPANGNISISTTEEVWIWNNPETGDVPAYVDAVEEFTVDT